MKLVRSGEWQLFWNKQDIAQQSLCPWNGWNCKRQEFLLARVGHAWTIADCMISSWYVAVTSAVASNSVSSRRHTEALCSRAQVNIKAANTMHTKCRAQKQTYCNVAATYLAAPIYLITVYTIVINTDLSDCNKHIRLHAHRPFKVGGYFLWVNVTQSCLDVIRSTCGQFKITSTLPQVTPTYCQ